MKEIENFKFNSEVEVYKNILCGGVSMLGYKGLVKGIASNTYTNDFEKYIIEFENIISETYPYSSVAIAKNFLKLVEI